MLPGAVNGRGAEDPAVCALIAWAPQAVAAIARGARQAGEVALDARLLSAAFDERDDDEREAA